MTPFWKKTDAAVKEMWIGIAVWGLFCGLAAIWCFPDRVRFLSGLLLGCLLASAGVFHMWKVLDRALDLGEGAQKYLTARSLGRYAVFVLVFLVLALTKWADPFAAFLGLMGMKIAAYLQPLVHKLLKKRR